MGKFLFKVFQFLCFLSFILGIAGHPDDYKQWKEWIEYLSNLPIMNSIFNNPQPINYILMLLGVFLFNIGYIAKYIKKKIIKTSLEIEYDNNNPCYSIEPYDEFLEGQPPQTLDSGHWETCCFILHNGEAELEDVRVNLTSISPKQNITLPLRLNFAHKKNNVDSVPLSADEKISVNIVSLFVSFIYEHAVIEQANTDQKPDIWFDVDKPYVFEIQIHANGLKDSVKKKFKIVKERISPEAIRCKLRMTLED